MYEGHNSWVIPVAPKEVICPAAPPAGHRQNGVLPSSPGLCGQRLRGWVHPCSALQAQAFPAGQAVLLGLRKRHPRGDDTKLPYTEECE